PDEQLWLAWISARPRLDMCQNKRLSGCHLWGPRWGTERGYTDQRGRTQVQNTEKRSFTFTFSTRFCPKRRTRERTVKLRAMTPGVTINKYYFTLEISQNEIKRKKECRSVTAVIASDAIVEVPVRTGSAH